MYINIKNDNNVRRRDNGRQMPGKNIHMRKQIIRKDKRHMISQAAELVTEKTRPRGRTNWDSQKRMEANLKEVSASTRETQDRIKWRDMVAVPDSRSMWASTWDTSRSRSNARQMLGKKCKHHRVDQAQNVLARIAPTSWEFLFGTTAVPVLSKILNANVLKY